MANLEDALKKLGEAMAGFAAAAQPAAVPLEPARLALVEETASVKRTAELLGVSVPMVYKLMDRGELGYTKIGRSRKVLVSSIRELIERNIVPARAQ